MSMCPVDSVPMVAENVRGVTFEVCPQCAGVWCNPDEMTSLLRQDPEAYADMSRGFPPKIEQRPGQPTNLSCPNCRQMLREYHYLFNSPVLLHTCDRCGGVWIAHEQLNNMQQFLDAGRNPAPQTRSSALQEPVPIPSPQPIGTPTPATQPIGNNPFLARSSPEARAEALAAADPVIEQAVFTHEAFMARQQNIALMSTALSMYSPGWFGFLP